MSALAIIVGGAGAPSRAVRGQLRDWSAVGLLDPFLYVDGSNLDGEVSAVPADLIAAGAATRVGVREHLADVGHYDVLRIVVANFLLPDVAPLRESALGSFRRSLQGWLSGARASSLNCLLVRHRDDTWTSDAPWLGWHNLVVAPQDSLEPTSLADLFDRDGDNDAFYCNGAMAIASLGGLWSGDGEAPFDALQEDPNNDRACIVTRSFHRRLDWSDAAAAVEDRLAGSPDQLNSPRTGSRVLESFTEPSEACRYVADAVLGRHGDLFHEMAPPPAPERRRLGVIEALRLFFSFLGAALRNAPRAWLSHVMRSTSSAVASHFQRALFGESADDSSYEIVVNGFNSRGHFVSASELSDNSERLAGRLRSLMPSVETRVPYVASFWRDVIAGALTLADGGAERGIDPPRVNDAPGYVGRPHDIAPSPDDDFLVPQNLVPHVGIASIASYDARGLAAAERRLRQEAHGDGLGAPGPNRINAQRCLDDLAAWFASHSSSYFVRIGARLVVELDKAQRALSECAQRLAQESGEADEVPQSIAEAQRRVTSHLRRWFGGLLAVLIAMAVLTPLGIVSALVAVLASGIALVIWLVGSLVTFFHNQRALFELLARRRHVDDGVLERLLADAARRVQVVSALYAQYECWTPLLARFLERPFFGARAAAASPLDLEGPLPRSLGVARAVPSTDAIVQVSEEISHDLFQSGWLQQQWIRYCETIESLLGAGEGASPGEALFLDDTRGQESPLRRAREMLPVSDDLAAGESALTGALRVIGEAGGEALLRALTQKVLLLGDQRGQVPDGAGFLSELFDEGNALSGGFIHDLFVQSAIASFEPPWAISGATVTVDGKLNRRGSGPGVPAQSPDQPPRPQNATARSLVLVQTSRRLSAEIIRLGVEDQTQEPDEDVSDVPPLASPF